MTPSSWNRALRIWAASVLTVAVIAVVTGAIALALRVGPPDPWLPRAGHAFPAGSRPAGHDRCAPIVGPAKAYCARSTALASHRPIGARAAWRLGCAGAGAAVLLVWRLRPTAGRRRH